MDIANLPEEIKADIDKKIAVIDDDINRIGGGEKTNEDVLAETVEANERVAEKLADAETPADVIAAKKLAEENAEKAKPIIEESLKPKDQNENDEKSIERKNEIHNNETVTNTQPQTVEEQDTATGTTVNGETMPAETGKKANEIQAGTGGDAGNAINAVWQKAKEKISSLFDFAIKNRSEYDWEDIASISKEEANNIRQKTGIDIDEDYKHVIESDAINHIMNRHGNGGSGITGNQIPVTKADFELIPDIIVNPDNIRKGDTVDGKERILYEKKFEDGTTVFIEEVRTGRKKLAVKTMYKIRGEHSGGSVNPVENPSLTSIPFPDPSSPTTNIQKPNQKRKLNPNSRTGKQIMREPVSISDAINQFFLGGGALKTEDFIRLTGFGYTKTSSGRTEKLTMAETKEYLETGKLITGEEVKASRELRQAKFHKKVADDGASADGVLMSFPEYLQGDGGMDLVSMIGDKAANYSKGEMLRELEASDERLAGMGQAPSELDLAESVQLTDEELAEMEANASLEISQDIFMEVQSIKLSEEDITRLNHLTEKYTNKDGIIDWNALENAYIDQLKGNSFDFLIAANETPLKQIFEYGNETIKRQAEQRAKSKIGIGNTGVEKDGQNDPRGSAGIERQNEQPTASGEAGLDNGRAMESGAIDISLAEPERWSGISKTVEAANTAGVVSTIRDADEREELESRGINPDYSKTEFREKLREEAKKNGVWLEPTFLDDKNLIHDRKQKDTSENDVYKNTSNGKLVKLNNLSYVTGVEKENNLQSLIDRIQAHNALFPNISYKILGFMDNKHGVPSLVLEQNEAVSERNATQQEIDPHWSCYRNCNSKWAFFC